MAAPTLRENCSKTKYRDQTRVALSVSARSTARPFGRGAREIRCRDLNQALTIQTSLINHGFCNRKNALHGKCVRQRRSKVHERLVHFRRPASVRLFKSPIKEHLLVHGGVTSNSNLNEFFIRKRFSSSISEPARAMQGVLDGICARSNNSAILLRKNDYPVASNAGRSGVVQELYESRHYP